MSADARRLLTLAPGSIYTSTDSGTTWNSNSAPFTNWVCAASSADGSKVFVANCDYVSYPYAPGMIYALQTTPTPSLSIALHDTKLLLSWVVPSMSLVLQETSDLSSATRMDVTVAPTLNYTNPQLQATVPRPSGNRFCRLIAR